MVSCYRLKELGLTLPAGSHILQPEAVKELYEATTLLEAAEREAASIRQEAELAYASEKARGFSEGQQKAEEEAAARILEETHLLAERLKSLEAELVDLVVGCVRQILREFDGMDLAQTVVRNALNRMRSEKTVQLRVAPTQVKEIRAGTERLLREFPEMELIDVIADDRLEPPRMVVESAIGRIDLDLDKGLERLRIVIGSAAAGLREVADV